MSAPPCYQIGIRNLLTKKMVCNYDMMFYFLQGRGGAPAD